MFFVITHTPVTSGVWFTENEEKCKDAIRRLIPVPDLDPEMDRVYKFMKIQVAYSRIESEHGFTFDP